MGSDGAFWTLFYLWISFNLDLNSIQKAPSRVPTFHRIRHDVRSDGRNKPFISLTLVLQPMIDNVLIRWMWREMKGPASLASLVSRTEWREARP